MLKGKIYLPLLAMMAMTSLAVLPVTNSAQAQNQPQAQQQAAQTPPPPQQPKGPVFSMADVMAKIKAQNAAEAKLIKEREAKFREAMVEQERLAKETTDKRNAAEARSNALAQQIEKDFAAIQDMKVVLEQHQGNLGELFGVTRQIAGDAAGVLSNSLVNTQIKVPEGEENRVDFLRRVASAKELPSIRELERMWMEILGEIKSDSEVARFNAPVSQLDGNAKDSEVVRVGSFMSVADGKYLAYIPSQNQLKVMERQPPQLATMAAARSLQSQPAGNGYFMATVDPARGVLLALIAERPNVLERIAHGESVGYLIIAVGLLGVLVAVFQYFYLFIVKIAVSRQLKNLAAPSKNNPLGRLMIAANGDGKKDLSHDLPELAELRISEAVLREIPKLERFQSFLRLAVAAGPLLGLIGTVIGMILTFQSITASGTSDPKLMAHGIGQAMIATVLGLGIAIPLLFINAGLTALSKSVIHVLEEQSNALLAGRLGEHAKK